MKRITGILFALGVVALMVSCGGNAMEKNSQKLKANKWLLEKVIHADSADVIMPPKNVTLNFADSSRLNGRGGCNGFFGSYEVTDASQLTLKVVGSTMMYCMNMDFETKYFEMLDAVKNYEVSETSLELKDADGKLSLVYIVAPEEQK